MKRIEMKPECIARTLEVLRSHSQQIMKDMSNDNPMAEMLKTVLLTSTRDLMLEVVVGINEFAPGRFELVLSEQAVETLIAALDAAKPAMHIKREDAANMVANLAEIIGALETATDCAVRH